MENRRKYLRYLLVTDIEPYKKNKIEKTKAKTKNIAEGGICITTVDKPLNKGDIYVLSFTIPGQTDSLVFEGKAVWSRKYQSETTDMFDNGIEFINADKNLLKKIEDFKLGAVFE